ncbi:uncharacterized protein [Parasteatoda tepidariorum]|uniref:uncharacterized protein isoform X2 n=1 Tax=Parasteatoda tepidariorum TaxID=114398 RepID=UPI0039BD3494
MNVCFRKIEHLKMNLYIVLFLLFNSRFSFVESFLDVLQCVMCSAKTEELSKMYRKCHLKLPKQIIRSGEQCATKITQYSRAEKQWSVLCTSRKALYEVYICTQVKTKELVCIGEIEDKYCR